MTCAAKITMARVPNILNRVTDWKAHDKAELFILKGTLGTWPTKTSDAIRDQRMSWIHQCDNALTFASRDKLLLRQLSRENLSLAEQFDVALAYAYDAKYEDELNNMYGVQVRHWRISTRTGHLCAGA